MDSRTAAMPPKLDDETDTVRIQIVAPKSWVAWIHAYRGMHANPPNLSASIRELVEYALIAKGVKKPNDA